MIVFARATDSYGKTLFRFKGVFVYDTGHSTPTRSFFKRSFTSTNTIRPQIARPYDLHEKFGGAGMIGAAEAQAFMNKVANGEFTLQR
jgi:hypothetical protein